VKFEGADEMPTPRTDEVAPGYFATMGIPVLLGREFNEQDVQGGPPVAMINEVAADKYLPGENPVGRHVHFGIDPKGTLDVEIVGVVKGVRQNEIRGEIPDFTYQPLHLAGGNGEVTSCSLAQVNDTDDDVGVPGIRWRPISADYFRALGIPLLKGWYFTDQDRADSVPVIIISDSMARRFSPNRNPVGTYLTEMRNTRTQKGGQP
jgi:hypothetical protein